MLHAGGGLYLKVDPKLYIFKASVGDEHLVIFKDNHANYGGAIYVADDTNSGACSPYNECFIQSLLYNLFDNISHTLNILFSGNTALVSKEPISLEDYWTDASQVHLLNGTGNSMVLITLVNSAT